VVGIAIIALAAFLKLVSVSAKLRQQLDNLQSLISINNQEIQILNGHYTQRPDGSSFQQPHHSYSHDLDILGKASLFQYIHRTNSEQGHQLLASWLLNPADEVTIAERQEAGIELRNQPEWRQELQARGSANALTFSIQSSLAYWISQPHRFRGNAAWKVMRFILPAISLGLLVLYIFDVVAPGVFYLMLLVFLAGSGYISKLITPQYVQLSKYITQFETLLQSLEWIESAELKSKLLRRLQSKVKEGPRSGSGEVKALKKILDRMDYRLNPPVFIVLNIFLYWDLQQVLQLEEWKARHQNKLNDWFETIAEVEALSSFANLSFNHPHWTFPVIKEEWFSLKCKQAGHPLIPAAKNVKNDFGMEGHPQLAFVTGSNMAGKSTFLRTIGTNLVLAMAGAPVCAEEFETPVLKVMTSMRIADNLEESASTFYAELQKLKSIIEAVKGPAVPRLRSGLGDDMGPSTPLGTSPRIFILLDEILRGTNSLDRHTGSEALIKQMIKEDAVGIIASHDLSLAELHEQYPNILRNYHFDVSIHGTELSFDYKLKPGVCQTLNATLLMKKIGIDL
jgi:hypothetical protein